MDNRCNVHSTRNDKGEIVICSRHGTIGFVPYKDYQNSKDYLAAVLKVRDDHKEAFGG